MANGAVSRLDRGTELEQAGSKRHLLEIKVTSHAVAFGSHKNPTTLELEGAFMKSFGSTGSFY